MEKLLIRGGSTLSGKIKCSGAKLHTIITLKFEIKLNNLTFSMNQLFFLIELEILKELFETIQ